MNRLWLIGGLVVLGLAAVLGWLSAGKEAQLYTAMILADAGVADCDGPQVHLTLGNAADRTMTKVTGVLSAVVAGIDDPVPAGNFEIVGPIAPGQKVEACVAADETALEGKDRAPLTWLARATEIAFGG